MLKTTHLNEFVTPLVRFLIFAVSSIDLANNLERIEKLIDRLRVEEFLPNLLIVIHKLHAG
jgi:hypothetical protein